jgi:hypothetical protein
LLKEKIESGKYFCNNDQQTTAAAASEQVNKKPPFAGTLSTSIGSTVDILLNH